jgi:very-short-patch-repair endonuclease
MTVPDVYKIDGPLKRIFDALCRYRKYTEFATSGRKLGCDIVIPSQRIIVEYDEPQHFTEPRALALRLYPEGADIGFDKAKWIGYCETMKARDNDPPYRDEQRAFYDSVRDLLAPLNGYRVVRLKHDDGELAWDAIARALARDSRTSHPAITTEIVVEFSTERCQ